MIKNKYLPYISERKGNEKKRKSEFVPNVIAVIPKTVATIAMTISVEEPPPSVDIFYYSKAYADIFCAS